MLCKASSYRTVLNRIGVRFSSTGLTKPELKSKVETGQAPNRETTWSKSQRSRINVIAEHPVRFIQKNLEEQPRPYAAIDLIAQEPIRYVDAHIAVCDGNKGSNLQGHPKIFINLDQPKANTCGYCGLRYAREDFKEIIEGKA